jgi:hypothetical protein
MPITTGNNGQESPRFKKVNIFFLKVGNMSSKHRVAASRLHKIIPKNNAKGESPVWKLPNAKRTERLAR